MCVLHACTCVLILYIILLSSSESHAMSSETRRESHGQYVRDIFIECNTHIKKNLGTKEIEAAGRWTRRDLVKRLGE